MQEVQKPKYKKSTILHGKVEKSEKKDSHYVDNDKLYAAFVEREKEVQQALAEGKEKPPLSNYIGDCFIKIANNLARKYQFASYSYKEEMILDAILHCVKYADSFKTNTSTNPFSYFTQACYYQFLAKIKEEKEELYAKCSATMNSIVYEEFAEQAAGPYSEDYQVDTSVLDVEFMQTFMADFEGKQAEKKSRLKKKSKFALDTDE